MNVLCFLILMFMALVSSQVDKQALDLAGPPKSRMGGGTGRRVVPVPMIAVTLNEDRYSNNRAAEVMAIIKRFCLNLLKTNDSSNAC